MPTIMPVSDLQRNFKSVADACAVSKEPVYLTRNGYPSLVIIDAETYQEEERFRKSVYEHEMRLRDKALEAHEHIEHGETVSLAEARELRSAR